MRPKQFNKAYYTTGSYNDYLASYISDGENTLKAIDDKLKLQPGWLLLDVGCGMGGTIIAARNRRLTAFGTEISSFCLKHSPVKQYITRADITALPFPDNQFELVICQEVLYYLNHEQLKPALKELGRITKQYLFVDIITKYSLNSNQHHNPDPLRQGHNLLSKRAWRQLFMYYQLKPICPVFPYPQNPDLNYLLEKLNPATK